MNRLPAYLLAFFFCLAAWASESNLGAAALHQAELDAATDLRLMCVAAHPDDEDGATLALYRKQWGYHTTALLATRGEGGQNEIGPELYEKLAVIRTREMAAASEVTGAELMFLNLPEFGYSKTLEETLSIWGEEEALERLVRAIRVARPDVIISNHGTMVDHGHHQACGHLLRLAFDAAADAARFPEHVAEGHEAWQVQRLFFREWQPHPDAIDFDFNALEPMRGKTYAEIAAEALEEHQSQGMQFFIDLYREQPRSSVRARYRLIREALHADAGQKPAPGGLLFEGIMDREPAAARDGTAPIRAGLELVVTVDDDAVVRGQGVTVQAYLINHGDALERGAPVSWGLEAAPHFAAEHETIAEGTDAASFWLVCPPEQAFTVPAYRHVFDDTVAARPVAHVTATVTLDGTPVMLRQPLHLDVAPTVVIEPLHPWVLVRRGLEDSATVQFALTNFAPESREAAVRLDGGSAFGAQDLDGPTTLAGEGAQRIVSATLPVAADVPPGEYPVDAIVDGGTDRASVMVRVLDLAVPEDARVGVIQSYDDTFVTTLALLGVPHETLGLADFADDRLDQFTHIIVDIRAYFVRPDLTANNAALLAYAQRGGVLLVNYQKTSEWDPAYAPYSITVSRNRVTNPAAAVTHLVPDHPLFHTPNAITPGDWDGWRQERGLYFPAAWDAAYTPLLSMNDPNEDLPPGSLLAAGYGRGLYVYCALGLYRQLREGNPGALRLFANMLALEGAAG